MRGRREALSGEGAYPALIFLEDHGGWKKADGDTSLSVLLAAVILNFEQVDQLRSGR